MLVLLQWIPGFMVGIEFVTEEAMIVFDLGILRVMLFYGKEKPA